MITTALGGVNFRLRALACIDDSCCAVDFFLQSFPVSSDKKVYATRSPVFVEINAVGVRGWAGLRASSNAVMAFIAIRIEAH
jgi:hypothetical protein